MQCVTERGPEGPPSESVFCHWLLAPILFSYEASPWGRRSCCVVCPDARVAGSKNTAPLSDRVRLHRCGKLYMVSGFGEFPDHFRLARALRLGADRRPALF